MIIHEAKNINKIEGKLQLIFMLICAKLSTVTIFNVISLKFTLNNKAVNSNGEAELTAK